MKGRKLMGDFLWIQMERKWRDLEMVGRYHAPGISFESSAFEYSGDLESEGNLLSMSLRQIIDDNLQRITESPYQILK